MPKKLFNSSENGLFSPFIDVVLNGLAIFFIMLVLYMYITKDLQKKSFLAFAAASNLPKAVVGEEYRFDFNFIVTGGEGARSYEYINPPSWVQADSIRQGVIDGFPPDSLIFQEDTIRVRVSDAQGNSVEEEFSIAIRPSCTWSTMRPLAFLTKEKALKKGRVGTYYETTISATGGSYDYAWSYDKRLPSGLTLEDGKIRGIPLTPFSDSISIYLSNARAGFSQGDVHNYNSENVIQQSFFLEIYPPTPQITLQLPEYGRKRSRYVGSVELQSDLLEQERLVWSISDLYTGLEVSTSGLILSGVPNTHGLFETTLYFINQEGDSTILEQATINILDDRPIASLESASLLVPQNQEFRYPISYEGLIEPVEFNILNDTSQSVLIINNALYASLSDTREETTISIEATDATNNKARGKITLQPLDSTKEESPDYFFIALTSIFFCSTILMSYLVYRRSKEKKRLISKIKLLETFFDKREENLSKINNFASLRLSSITNNASIRESLSTTTAQIQNSAYAILIEASKIPPGLEQQLLSSGYTLIKQKSDSRSSTIFRSPTIMYQNKEVLSKARIIQNELEKILNLTFDLVEDSSATPNSNFIRVHLSGNS
ncbi:MAG: hypothetical protein AAFP77_19450 [Bacteroidota bacterium]